MKKINIIFPAKLGDGLTLTPILNLLKANGYEINLFCSEYNKIIFENNPNIKDIISLPWNIFRNFRFPIIPKFWSIFKLFIYQFGKFQNFKDLPTFVINENIQSYIFGRLLSKNIYYKTPIYHFLGGKEINLNKNKLFSYQILEFFEKSLDEKFNFNKNDFKYKIFWNEINFEKIKEKISSNFKKNFIWYNLSATLAQKELTLEENIKKIRNLLNRQEKILITDYDINTSKINKIKNVFGNEIFYLNKKLNLEEIYNLSKYCKAYYGPDSGISHLISIQCKNCNIFFTKQNRVEKTWLPLQNSKFLSS